MGNSNLIRDALTFRTICKGDNSLSSSSKGIEGDRGTVPSSELVILDLILPWNVVNTFISFEEASALICLQVRIIDDVSYGVYGKIDKMDDDVRKLVNYI